jgi:predicted NAD/FAD-dependent oxidoreductase
VGPLGIDGEDGHTRFRGVDTMNAVAKHLARGLDVRTGTAAEAVTRSGSGWVVAIGDDSLQADAVVLTAPVPQSLALLEAGAVILADDDTAALRAIRYEPCLAVLAVLDAPPQLPDPGAVDPGHGPIDWMADNQRKGVSAAPAITIHATADFSREHWNSRDEAVVAALIGAAGLARAPVVVSVQVHRWRYARPVEVHPTRCLMARGVPPLVFAGDAFGGAKVEGAVLSGRAAATW